MTLQYIIDNKIPHKPILFNLDMVGATLDGRKTQTRRIFKGQLDSVDIKLLFEEFPEYCLSQSLYGKTSDLLWVREKWRVIGWPYDDSSCGFDIEYADGSVQRGVQLFEYFDDEREFVEKLCDQLSMKCESTVNEEEETFSWTAEQIKKHMPWKPSIHMPKAASRIWLRIKDIRVERLQDISIEDCKAEGIESIDDYWGEKGWYNYYGGPNRFRHDWFFEDAPYGYEGVRSHEGIEASFFSLIAEIHGWEFIIKNPWVWVIEFEVLSTTGVPSLDLLSSSNLTSYGNQ